MKKLILLILSLFVFSCNSGGGGDDFILSSSLLDECNNSIRGNYITYQNNEYYCGDLEVLGDFITSNYNLQERNIKDIINGYSDYNEFNVLFSSWNNGRLLELRIFYDLTIIPSTINNLEELQGLDLGDFNQLTIFEPNLCNLINLNNLDLSRNFITEIPQCISNLTQLDDLDLDENQINDIPESLCELANNNCYIELDSNNLCEEFNFECFTGNTWDFNGEKPQDQSNCCEGENGESNWATCP